VDGHRLQTGELAWHADVNWALPGGDVVVLQQRAQNPDADKSRDRGYSVVEPATGTVLWGDRDAIAAWVYSDRIVDLSCPDSGDCQLRARNHRDGGQVLWSVAVPGGARTISGANPALAGTRDPAEWAADAGVGTPRPLPPVIGLTVDGRLQVIDTVAGTRLREFTAPDRQTRVALSNGRILLSHAEPGASGCRYWVEALDAKTGQSQWRKDGYDLDTASGAGCEQRRDPLGAGNRLVARGSDNVPRLLDVATGEPMWTGVPGERVLATDGLLAVVEGADRKTVRVLDLLDAHQVAVWLGEVGLDSKAVITREFVIISDSDKGRVIVLNHGSRVLADVKTKASLVGYGPAGLVLASGRKIGFIPVSG
jgi:outer membrane protein assembly factor BamB